MGREKERLRGFGPGKHHRESQTQDLCFSHNRRIGFPGFEELLEQVFPIGFAPVGPELFPRFHFPGGVGNAGVGSAGSYAQPLSQHQEGVVPLQVTQDWHLAPLIINEQGYGSALQEKKMWLTYEISICQGILDKDNDSMNILLLLNKTVSLAVSEITNDVKGEIVEPCEEIDVMRLVGVVLLNLLHEGLNGVLHEVLIRCSCTGGEGSIDTLAKIMVPFLVHTGEQGVDFVAMLHRHIDGMVAGLGRRSVKRTPPHMTLCIMFEELTLEKFRPGS